MEKISWSDRVRDDICLVTEEKAQINLSQGSRRVPAEDDIVVRENMG